MVCDDVTDDVTVVVMTSLMVCCGFIFCFSFLAIYVFGTYLSGGTLDSGNWFYQLSMTLIFANSCINPFISVYKLIACDTVSKN